MSTALPTGTLDERRKPVKVIGSVGESRHGQAIQLQAVTTLATTTAASNGSFEVYFAAIVRSVVREELAAALPPLGGAPYGARAPSEYLTVARAAEIADVHPCTIREWIKAGSLRAYRCGQRTYRVLRSDLDARLTIETSDPTSEELRERVDEILAKRRSKRRKVEEGT